jgi:signal transduction histidine kinase
MFIFTYIAAFMAIVFAVGAALLVYKKRDPIREIMCAYILSSAVWIGSNAAADVAYQHNTLLLASQIAYAGAMSNFFFTLLFVDYWIAEGFPTYRRILSYGVPCLLLLVFGFTPCAIVGTSFPSGEPAQIVPGILYSISIYVVFAGLIYCCTRLYHYIKNEEDAKIRSQFLWIFSGLLLTTICQIIFDGIVPILGELRYFTVGPICSIFFIIGAGYAVAKYQFLEIRLVVKRRVLYSFLFVMVVFLYFTLLQILDKIINETSLDSEVLSIISVTIIGFLSIPHIDRIFRNITDQWFFKNTYTSVDAVAGIGKISQSWETELQIVEIVEAELMKLLRAEWVEVTLSIEEAEQTRPAEISIPICAANTTIGYLRCGAKRSGDTYTSEDIVMIETFSHQVAMAVSHTKLFRKVASHPDSIKNSIREETMSLGIEKQRQENMLADIAHKLMTPLTIFSTKVDSLRGVGLSEKECAPITSSLGDLSNFVSDLLMLTGLPHSFEREPFSNFSLSKLVGDIADETEIITSAQRFCIERNIEEGLTMFGNEKRMREALLTVVENAVKYSITENNQRITFTLSHTSERITICITDTGMGISPDDIPHIFDRFYRVHTSATRCIKGSGLGLAIVKEIIDQHKGTVTATSIIGVGTTFEFSIPHHRKSHHLLSHP